MDITKESIIVKQHEIIVDIGDTGHRVKLRVRQDGTGFFVAIVTGHIFPNGEECEQIFQLTTLNADLQTAVRNVVLEHFNSHHPKQHRPRLSIVKE